MTVKEQVEQQLDDLSEAELRQVAEYLEFLKFRSRDRKPSFDETQLAALYAEFGADDRAMAEEGLEDYVGGVAKEDAR